MLGMFLPINPADFLLYKSADFIVSPTKLRHTLFTILSLKK